MPETERWLGSGEERRGEERREKIWGLFLLTRSVLCVIDAQVLREACTNHQAGAPGRRPTDRVKRGSKKKEAYKGEGKEGGRRLGWLRGLLWRGEGNPLSWEAM